MIQLLNSYNLNLTRILGFELWIRFKPTEDINGPWTLVFEFKEPIDTALEYHVWQAKLTVSGNGRLATLTSMPYNMGLKKGDMYTIVMVISGAAKVGFKLLTKKSKLILSGKSLKPTKDRITRL